MCFVCFGINCVVLCIFCRFESIYLIIYHLVTSFFCRRKLPITFGVLEVEIGCAPIAIPSFNFYSMKNLFNKKETGFQKQGSAASLKRLFNDGALAFLKLDSNGQV